MIFETRSRDTEMEGTMIKRIGLLTSGGDCQALNAAMRGVVKGLFQARKDVEIYGFEEGYKGLIYSNFRMLKAEDFSGILTVGGTILGTSRQPFKLMRVPDENGLDKVEAMKHTYHKLSLDCLVILGGNGTHKTANLLREEGLNVVTLPKTIDNDLWGTDMTFGFHSAVEVATDTIDRIHTTATSHNRVFIIEIMGHKVGWVTLHAGIAGGADIILLPEIPYDMDVIAEAIDKRAKSGKKFTIIAVAEGAISKEDAKLSKKELKDKQAKKKYPSVAYEMAEKVQKRTQQEVRIAIPGHTQRGGSPCPFDRVLSTRLGAEAARAILDENYGASNEHSFDGYVAHINWFKPLHFFAENKFVSFQGYIDYEFGSKLKANDFEKQYRSSDSLQGYFGLYYHEKDWLLGYGLKAYKNMTQWKDNQGDISLPASHFEFFLAEYFNEQRRQIRFGNGILLSTVHGVKGEEFEHVIILDGAWQSAIEKNSAALEEERRVFYVAMTRAISRLVIMQRQDQTHPHIPLLSDFLHYETPKAPTPEKLRRFGCLGMRQLDISYAGAHPANHPIHNKLNSIKTNGKRR